MPDGSATLSLLIFGSAGLLCLLAVHARAGGMVLGLVTVGLLLARLFDGAPGQAEAALGIGAGIAFAGVAGRLRLLDRGGSYAGGLFAGALLGLGGWAWALPGLAFFVPSSLLSKVGRRRKAAAARLAEKGEVRDLAQVMANGGVAWVALAGHALYPNPLWYVAFLGALATASADTWATEIGTLFRGTPRLITTGRPVPQGTSGAVSAPGTLAALLGAGAVTLAAWPLSASMPGGEGMLIGVTAAGFAGALSDSLLGATLQARYREPATGQETERHGTADVAYPLVRGLPWLDNDRVNLAATFLGAVLAMACFRAAGFGS